MQKIAILTLTFKASGAVEAYRAVGFDGAQASVRGQKVLGVSGRDVLAGSYSDADAAGTTIVRCGGAFSKGDSLIVDAQGRAVKASGLISLKVGATTVTRQCPHKRGVVRQTDPEFAGISGLARDHAKAADFHGVSLLQRRGTVRHGSMPNRFHNGAYAANRRIEGQSFKKTSKGGAEDLATDNPRLSLQTNHD